MNTPKPCPVPAQLSIDGKNYSLMLHPRNATEVRAAIDQGHSTLVLKNLKLEQNVIRELQTHSPLSSSVDFSIDDKKRGPYRIDLTIHKNDSSDSDVSLTLELISCSASVPSEPPTGAAGAVFSMSSLADDKDQVSTRQDALYSSPIVEPTVQPHIMQLQCYECPPLKTISEDYYNSRTKTFRKKGTLYSSAELAMIREKENSPSAELPVQENYTLNNPFPLSRPRVDSLKRGM